jgi:hypothetical protein
MAIIETAPDFQKKRACDRGEEGPRRAKMKKGGQATSFNDKLGECCAVVHFLGAVVYLLGAVVYLLGAVVYLLGAVVHLLDFDKLLKSLRQQQIRSDFDGDNEGLRRCKVPALSLYASSNTGLPRRSPP